MRGSGEGGPARERARATARLARAQLSKLDMTWARCRPARAAREIILSGVLGPMIDFYARRRAVGRDQFRGLKPPVVLAANHSSHLDTPTILRALPRKWRQRTAVAAAADYFYRSRAVAGLVSLAFNTVPIERRGAGRSEDWQEHFKRLLEQRWNILFFPEGTRSRDGEIGQMRPGAALLATEQRIPLVPVYVEGTHRAMPPGQSWPRRLRGRLWRRRHRVTVHFGEPIQPGPDGGADAVMIRLRAFMEDRAGASPDRTNGGGPEPASPRLVPELSAEAGGGARWPRTFASGEETPAAEALERGSAQPSR
jgi:1-acyl-sn-glycerol-3-phosphate acyltransferase